MIKMSKREISQILYQATREEVLALSKLLCLQYAIKEIQSPQKTLVMVKARDTIENTLFYLGEVLACECMMEVAGVKGVAVVMGDDLEKTKGIAIIDGALNGSVKESQMIMEKVAVIGKQQKENRKALNGEILKSKVNFDVMGS